MMMPSDKDERYGFLQTCPSGKSVLLMLPDKNDQILELALKKPLD
jgi:hypothetical protein